MAGADLVGINMEGPFISKVKKGAQDERNILPCSTEIYKRFQKAARGLVKLIGVAPEESETEAFIREVKGKFPYPSLTPMQIMIPLKGF